MEEGIEVLVLNVTLCLFATWIFLYITMVTRIKISVLVSAPQWTLSSWAPGHQCPQQKSHARGHPHFKEAV